jgi:hypothetical protein
MPNIDFSKLGTLKYWLEGTTAGPDVNIIPVETGSFFYYFYVSVFCGFIVLAILLIIYKMFLSPEHPLQTKLGFLSQNFICWFLARQVEVSFVSSRLWLLIGLIWFIAIMAWFVRYITRYYKHEIAYFNKKNLEVANSKS